MSIKSQTSAKEASPPQGSDTKSSNFFEIPSCRLEDIDRALFNLFDKDLPLLYTHRNDTRRVPIIFATGERFALIARKKPLRDRSNTLILPVVSIMRTEITMANDRGGSFAPDIPQIIKKQISPEDPVYQRLINSADFKNSNDLVSDTAFIDSADQTGALPGRIATRRNRKVDPQKIQKGNVLEPNLSNNIFEIFEIPAPVYITVGYEITFWTQYVQEMNNLLSVMATESHFKADRSFRIETQQGYSFVAYIDGSISNQSNFDDFSEEERHVRNSFNMKVTGYILGSVYKGMPNKIKKYVSAPQISFEAAIVDNPLQDENSVETPSGNPDRYILQDLRSSDKPLPGQSVGAPSPVRQSEPNNSIGGFSNGAGEKFVKRISDPFSSGKEKTTILVTKTRSNRQGESVYREII